MGKLLFNIFFYLVLPVVGLWVGLWAGIYTFVKQKPYRKRIMKIVSLICLFFLIGGVSYQIHAWKQEKSEKQQYVKESAYDRQLLERQELRSKGRPQSYINGLGKDPLLQDSFNMGQKYEKKESVSKGH